MDEDIPELLLEVSVQEMRRAVMEAMGWDEAELAVQMDEARDQALYHGTDASNILEADDTPVDPESMTQEETEEAILSFLYQQYVVELV